MVEGQGGAVNPTRIRAVARGLAASPINRCPAARSDADLLTRFLDVHDEAAFADLVVRHLPAVRAVCRSVLRDPNDVDDAAQATFLVLVRRAAVVRDRAALGSWLCRVAWRTANRLRETNARRTRQQAPGIDPDTTPGREGIPASSGEVAAALHEEIGRLPERYRLAVLTCYAAGTPTAEAATRLGWPKGTLLTRLAWARKRLRDRLTKRGVTLSGGLTAVMAGHAGSAGGALLAGRITAAAVALMSGDPRVKELVSERVSNLTEGVVRAMAGTKFKLAVGVGFVVVALLGLGLGRMTADAGDAADKKPNTATGASPAKATAPREPAPVRPADPDPEARAEAPVAPAGPGDDLVVRRPHGSYTKEVPAYGKATITFTENRLHVHATVRLDGVNLVVTADGDYSMNRESMVYGIITAVDVSGLPGGEEAVEVALIAATLNDTPFAFRARAEDDSVTIKDLKFGPFGSLLFAEMFGGGDSAEVMLMIAGIVGGKYKADPNPDRNALPPAPRVNPPAPKIKAARPAG
jgi:RNA polymerase sigma factor (sigma-70 family)